MKKVDGRVLMRRRNEHRRLRDLLRWMLNRKPGASVSPGLVRQFLRWVDNGGRF